MSQRCQKLGDGAQRLIIEVEEIRQAERLTAAPDRPRDHQQQAPAAWLLVGVGSAIAEALGARTVSGPQLLEAGGRQDRLTHPRPLLDVPEPRPSVHETSRGSARGRPEPLQSAGHVRLDPGSRSSELSLPGEHAERMVEP
jgi:hypothetical protein